MNQPDHHTLLRARIAVEAARAALNAAGVPSDLIVLPNPDTLASAVLRNPQVVPVLAGHVTFTGLGPASEAHELLQHGRYAGNDFLDLLPDTAIMNTEPEDYGFTRELRPVGRGRRRVYPFDLPFDLTEDWDAILATWLHLPYRPPRAALRAPVGSRARRAISP